MAGTAHSPCRFTCSLPHADMSHFSWMALTATPALCHAAGPSFLTGCTTLAHSQTPEPSCCAPRHPLHIAFAAAHTSCALLCFPKALRQPARAKQAKSRPVLLTSARCSAPSPNAVHALRYTGRMAAPRLSAGNHLVQLTASKSCHPRAAMSGHTTRPPRHVLALEQ